MQEYSKPEINSTIARMRPPCLTSITIASAIPEELFPGFDLHLIGQERIPSPSARYAHGQNAKVPLKCYIAGTVDAWMAFASLGDMKGGKIRYIYWAWYEDTSEMKPYRYLKEGMKTQPVDQDREATM
ncbi:hypothetical protein ACMFMG_001712 [Clarireedia jacksonii]